MRRLNDMMEIVNTLPLWERPQYLMKYLPQNVFNVELQKARLQIAQKAWNKNPEEFLDKFVPMFLKGLN